MSGRVPTSALALLLAGGGAVASARADDGVTSLGFLPTTSPSAWLSGRPNLAADYFVTDRLSLGFKLTWFPHAAYFCIPATDCEKEVGYEAGPRVAWALLGEPAARTGGLQGLVRFSVLGGPHERRWSKSGRTISSRVGPMGQLEVVGLMAFPEVGIVVEAAAGVQYSRGDTGWINLGGSPATALSPDIAVSVGWRL